MRLYATVDLSCGDSLLFPNPYPRKGDLLLCMKCGKAANVKKAKRCKGPARARARRGR